MAMGSGMLALALIAADGPSCSPDEATTYQVRVLTIDGLDWRTSSYPRLTPVARQGTSAIWTADRALAMVLAERASSVATVGKIVATCETVLSQANSVNYVAAMDRMADGPINQSTAIAFMPRPETVEERFAIKIAGRKLDQGVLTRVTLEETHVDSLHTVCQTESLKSAPRKTTRATEGPGGDVKPFGSEEKVDSPRSLTTQVQIPEISQTRIDGEWLIPRDGVLLISLGVKTAADGEGKAVARERLAVIEANAPASPMSQFSQAEAPRFDKITRMSMPPAPSRSIPQAVDASGAMIDLPPLPEALASNDLDRIKPEPNQPSPQSPIIAEPGSDPAVARTSFDAPPLAPNPPLVEPAETTVNARMARLRKLQEALARAGFDLDLDINVDARDKSETVSTRPFCEKCDGDSLFCPTEARSFNQAEMAGGLKLVPERAGSIGLTLKDARGVQILNSDLKLDEALKTPGKTETSLIPLGGQVSLEIKATLVPSARATARKDKPETAN
jgi:hypothetical protein